MGWVCQKSNELAGIGAREKDRKHKLSGETAKLSALRKEHG